MAAPICLHSSLAYGAPITRVGMETIRYSSFLNQNIIPTGSKRVYTFTFAEMELSLNVSAKVKFKTRLLVETWIAFSSFH
eukprot:m.92016 g.92016  ORF g.92016 m.92016 type:complete len:80 (-) comp13329_c0_seq1:157-396(-)